MFKILLTCLLCFIFQETKSFDVYMSPLGNDQNNGSINKPVKTFNRAFQLLKLAIKEKKAATLWLRGGSYSLTAPITITPDLSGTAEAPVSIKAYKGEKPIINSDLSITGLQWKPYKKGIFFAKISNLPAHFEELYINNQLQVLARYPNFDKNAQYLNGTSADALDKKRIASWSNPTNGYIHALHASLWGDYQYLITGKKSDSTLTYIGGWQNNRPGPMHPKYRYVYNIFEELDTTNEWYVDKDKSTLYYFPPNGTDLKKCSIQTPQLSELFIIRGSKEEPVAFFNIDGITFSHTLPTFMLNKEPVLRTDWTIYRGGALTIEGSKNITIQNCLFTNLSGNAIFVNNFNRFLKISATEINDCGSNGIAFVGNPASVRNGITTYSKTIPLEQLDTVRGPIGEDFPAFCTVENCLLYHTGTIEKQTAPIEIDISHHITVSHCTIYDVPRAGINIGDGCWGGHNIEYCDVFETVKETGDHGSFNSWGRDRYWVAATTDIDKRVAQNPNLPLLDAVYPISIHNNRFRCDHGWDIDLDDGSSNYHIFDNLCLHGGIKNREGYNRIVENNIIIGNSFHPHLWLANSGDVFQKNIIYKLYNPQRMPKCCWGKSMDKNFRHIPNSNMSPDYELAKQSGRDKYSLKGDAQFVNPDKGDFSVSPTSPALKTGFKNFDMKSFGVLVQSLRNKAKQPSFERIVEKKAVVKDATPIVWKDVTIKNIVSDGEVSAYGLAGITGVLVLSISTNSPFYHIGLRKDDVIIGYNSLVIDDKTQLVNVTAPLLALKIVRGQGVRFLK